MKKIAFAIAALAAVVSCQKAETVYTGETVQLSFRVSREATANDTKAALSGTSVVFEDNDKLSVFDGTSNNIFQTTNGGDEALFTGSAADAASYLVVSPYNENYVQQSASVLRFSIPEYQTATPGSADPNALISIGKAFKGNSVTLYNAVALVEIVVPGGLEVKQIQVAGAKGATVGICGEFTFNANEKTLTPVSMKNVIYLNPKEGDDLIAPGTYYVAIRPKPDFDNGFAIAFVNSSNQLYKRTTDNKTLVIERGHIAPMGELNTTDYSASTSTGRATLRYADGGVQFTGTLKTLAGGAGGFNDVDTKIKKIVFMAHTLYPAGSVVSNGPNSDVQIHARIEGTTVYVCTEAPRIDFYSTSTRLFKNFAALEEVEFNDVSTMNSAVLDYLFDGCTSLKSVKFGNADFSKVTNFSYMFYNATSALEYVDFGETATTAATTMQSMFNNNQNLKYLNLGPNFTLAAAHKNMFLDTARQTSIDAAGDDAKKCQLYASQAFYDDAKVVEDNDHYTQFNPARFLFHAQ